MSVRIVHPDGFEEGGCCGQHTFGVLRRDIGPGGMLANYFHSADCTSDAARSEREAVARDQRVNVTTAGCVLIVLFLAAVAWLVSVVWRSA